MSTAAPTFVVGDVHGQLAAVRRVLAQANLIDRAGHWSAGHATLWFTGDFTDRGPDGVDAIEFAMRLQREAAGAGGAVHALLGNHDVMLLAAHRFGPDAGPKWGDQFMRDWLLNGGEFHDLDRLSPRHARWLAALPALATIGGGGTLLAHADAAFYRDYGDRVGDVNATIAALLAFGNPEAWHELIERFTRRREFMTTQGGHALSTFLAPFGATRLIHGHSPIPLVTGLPRERVDGPYVYADGRCVNVDAGLFLGSPGFVFEVPPPWLASSD